ncbi:hypothetical protein MLD38_001968 [Melastoma candidum]|uniref:Uncharacterized protein n=1 Tax=Melastoma candidum TaxID=119954 RepID=A0ACB9SGJ0_9MYRT|nr:hypothetical protein MLD38_001968 [Melastoma candidum]
MHGDNVIGKVLPESGTTSTDPNMASSQSFGGEWVHRGTKAARIGDAGGGSFQLFGQIIHAKHPVENVSAVATVKEGNGMKRTSGPECTNPHLGLSSPACFNGVKTGIAHGQTLNHVLL